MERRPGAFYHVMRTATVIKRHRVVLLGTCPDPTPTRRRGYLTSEFLVVLSQHVRKTGNPIKLLQSCDMKEN